MLGLLVSISWFIIRSPRTESKFKIPISISKNLYKLIRNGIKSNWPRKVLWSATGLLSCYQYYQIKQNLQYLNIFCVASIFGTVVEILMQRTKRRKGPIETGAPIEPATLFGERLSVFDTGFLRGTTESGSLTLMGLIAADYFLKHIDYKKDKQLLYSLGLMVFLMFGGTLQSSPLLNGVENTAVLSRRNMLDPVILFATFTAIGIFNFGLKTDRISRENKERLWRFFVFEAVIATAWNYLGFLVGVRWISRHLDAKKTRKSFFQWLGLNWNGIVERGAFYSVFVSAVFAFTQ